MGHVRVIGQVSLGALAVMLQSGAAGYKAFPWAAMSFQKFMAPFIKSVLSLDHSDMGQYGLLFL